MTLFHFGNCLALVYVPYYLTYKYSGLSEYRVLWKCCSAGCIYAFTQLCKMMILATFFPTAAEPSVHGQVSILAEIYKAVVEFGDIPGLYIALRGVPGKGSAKVLTAALGWACAELLLTRPLLLWVGARGAQFDWIYIQKCLQSNINLVCHIVSTTLVWLWTRQKLSQSFLVGPVLLLTVYRTQLLELFRLTAWSLLLAEAGYSLVLALLTLRMYAVFTHSSA